MSKIKQITLFPAQYNTLQSEAAITLLLCSRGYGKSYTLAYWCIKKLLTGCYAGMVIGPTYGYLKDTTKYILQHLEACGIEYELNCKPTWCKSLQPNHQGILSINCLDGKHHYLVLCSADNPDSPRGKSVDFMALDEAALLNETVIDVALPCLRGHPLGSQHSYQILLATTPSDTSNWIYKRFIGTHTDNFKEIKALAQENTIEFSESKLKLLQEQMTSNMWRREMECEWMTQNNNTMNYAFSKSLVKSNPEKTKDRLFISSDQNNINLQSVCGYLGQKGFHIDNEILIPEGGSPIKVAQEFHRLYQSTQSRHVVVCGDRTGHNKTLVSRSTYWEQFNNEMRRLGWIPQDRTNDKNPEVFSSNETFQRIMEQGHFSIDPKCKNIIKHLEEVRWKPSEFVMDKKFLDSGFQDSLRYVAWEFFNPLRSNGISRGNIS